MRVPAKEIQRLLGKAKAKPSQSTAPVSSRGLKAVSGSQSAGCLGLLYILFILGVLLLPVYKLSSPGASGTLAFLGTGAFAVLLVLDHRASRLSAERDSARQRGEIVAYLEKAAADGALSRTETSLFLENGEEALLECPAKLYETRAIRRSTGVGMGTRVGKRSAIGVHTSTSESTQEWRTLDSGTALLTSRRIVFDGSKEDRSIPLSKLMSAQTCADGLELSSSGKSKTMILDVPNPDLWAIVIALARENG
jgi:hypothetical protein